MSSPSMLGKWDLWYRGIKTMGSFKYGDTITYRLAAAFLADMPAVEDWGCGTGGFKRFFQGEYLGLDGSANPFVDKVVDLREYRSHVDGLIMRHVLEHNYDWRQVLENALASFNKKFCLIIFTPFAAETREIAHNKKYGVDVPDLSFSQAELEAFFVGLKWRKEIHRTRTAHRQETIYFLEKSPHHQTLYQSRP